LRNRFVIGARGDAIGFLNRSYTQTYITGDATMVGGTKDAVVVAHSHGVSETSRGEKKLTGLVNFGSGGNFDRMSTGGDIDRPFQVTTADNHTHSVSVNT